MVNNTEYLGIHIRTKNAMFQLQMINERWGWKWAWEWGMRNEKKERTNVCSLLTQPVFLTRDLYLLVVVIVASFLRISSVFWLTGRKLTKAIKTLTRHSIFPSLFFWIFWLAVCNITKAIKHLIRYSVFHIFIFEFLFDRLQLNKGNKMLIRKRQ